MPNRIYSQTPAPRVITLAQAIDSSLKLNKDVKKAEIKADISKHLITQAQQKMIPELNFHTGFSVTSPLDQFQNGTDRAPVRYDIPWQIYDFSTNASVPLFMGGKITNDIRKQKQESVLSEQNLEKEKRDDRLEVIGYYLNIYYYMEQEKVVMQNMYEDSVRIKQVRSLKKNGAVTENEVLRAELLLSDHSLLKLTIRNNEAIALHQLKTLLEIHEDDDITIDTAGLTSAAFLIPTYEASLSTAMKETDDLKMSRTEESIKRIDEKIIKGNFYPTITAKGDYGFYHPNYEFFPPVNYAYRIGSIGVSLVFNVSTLYKNWQQVSISKKQTEWQMQETKKIAEKVEDKVYEAHTQYMEALQRIDITEQAAKQAAENYRIVKKKYLNQLALITELIDADNTLLDTRTKAVTARIDARMKFYQLLYVIGKL
jgi:outer membrane protein TolC